MDNINIQQEINVILSFLNRPLKIEMETTPLDKAGAIQRLENVKQIVDAILKDLGSCQTFLKKEKIPDNGENGKPLPLQERLELLKKGGKDGNETKKTSN